MKTGFDVLCKNMIEMVDKNKTYRQILEYLTENTDESTDFWRYNGIPVLFLQEITKFYEVLENDNFNSEDCTNICFLINILQTIASKENIRMEIIRIQLPFFLYPFLNSSNISHKNELLRIASLSFINVFIQSDEQQNS